MAGLTAAGATALTGGLALAGTIGGIAANAGLTRRARRENYQYNEMAAENAYKRQIAYQTYLQSLAYKQYYDLESPAAIMRQLKEAGLSPSLYAQNAVGGGVSGVSTGGSAPQGGGASGIGAPQIPLAPIDAAQIGLIAAQTKKVNAEADVINGKNDRGKAEIAKILADTVSAEAAANYNKMLTAHEEIKKAITSATSEDQIARIHYLAEEEERRSNKLLFEIDSARAQAQIDMSTISQKIKQEEYKANLLNAEILAKYSDIQLNEAKINEINNECEKWREELMQGWWQIFIEKEKSTSYKKYVDQMGKYQDDQIQTIIQRMNMDEDHFTRSQRLEWHKFIYSIYADAQRVFTSVISSAL